MASRTFGDYKATEVLTADPTKIILMLYDGALSFMYQASEAAKNRNHLERANKIRRTNDILLELLSSLDFEKGGEIARNLREIYVFLVKELLNADLKNDAEAISRCAQVLETIRDAWKKYVVTYAGRRSATDKASAQIPSFI